jgi:pilus assembly protein CpaE
LPHPVAMEDVARIDPEALRRVIGLLKAAFSTVVIDASKSLQASDLIAFESADTILLAVQLELVCIRNTARLLKVFRQFDGLVDRVKVVANRTGSREGEIGPKKAEETLGMSISWQVPNASREFANARCKGVTLATESANSKPHRALAEIARALVPPPEPAAREKSRLGRFAASFF